MRTITRYRSSITGRWVAKAYALAHPETTVKETEDRERDNPPWQPDRPEGWTPGLEREMRP